MKFHDETKQEFYITEQTRASELVHLIAESLLIPDVYDFKLYETDENKLRPIKDDELVLGLARKGFLKNKSLLFRKYIYLPKSFEDEETSNNVRRIQLVTFQDFYDIQQGIYLFQLDDYVLVACLFLIIQSSTSFELVTKVVPTTAYKQKPKSWWQEEMKKIMAGLNANMIEYLEY